MSKAPYNFVGNAAVGTASARATRRAQIRRDALALADASAMRTGRSIKCGEWGHHANDQRFDGCQNDGSTCICECHDPAAHTGEQG